MLHRGDILQYGSMAVWHNMAAIAKSGPRKMSPRRGRKLCNGYVLPKHVHA